MPRKSVAIVVAMPRELGPLLRGVKPHRVDGIALYELENAVVAAGGIGCEAARLASEKLVAYAQPAILVSAGAAGALRPELKVGHVGTAREVLDASTGSRYPTGDGDCVLVTAGTVSGERDKRGLRERFGADLVDMEGAAVAEVAREHGLEFAAIKVVSDELDFAMPPLARFVEYDGKFATAKFVAYVAVRPWWWRSIIELSKNSRMAAMNLSAAVQHLIDIRRKQQEEKVFLDYPGFRNASRDPN